MDRLFQEGASGRRRFLDRLVLGLDPAHAGRAAAYEHAMRERARLLRQGRGDAKWLGALEETMAARGVAMAQARRELVARLDEACRAADGAFPRGAVAVGGLVEAWLTDTPADEAEARFRALLATNRRRDAEAGTTTEGPHRSDLRVRHLGKDMPAEQCSTGEQKALLVALVLAQAGVQRAVRGSPPLLLLDEVAAHLDEARRDALFRRLAGLGAQSWLTGTDVEAFAGFGGDAQCFRVHDGVVTRVN